MTYTPVHVNWEDDPSTATPILGADLEHMEAGIVEGTRPASETQTGNVELATVAEMNSGADLVLVPAVKRVADYVAAQISSALSGLPSAVDASETVKGIVELSTAAELNTGTDLGRVPSVKRVADYVTAAVNALSVSTNAAIVALSASTTSALGGKVDKTGSIKQLSDVSDTPFTDGDVPMFDSSSAALEPTDMATNFAGLDANLRLAAPNFPQFYVPTIVIEEGTVPPGTFPAYGLIGKLPAAASLIPTFLDVDSVRAANNVVLQLPEAVLAGSYIGFTIGWSNEAPFDHISAAFGGTGAGTGVFDFGTLSIPNTTAAELNGFVKVLTDAAAGSTITFTARDVANAAINRVHLIASIYRLPNLVSSSPRDQQAVNGGASTSTLTAVGATIGTSTSQPSEIAIGSGIISSGTTPNLRDLAGTNDWQTIVNHLSDNGSSGRRLYVGYKILTAMGLPALTTLVTLSGTATQTGQWAAKLDTFKGI